MNENKKQEILNSSKAHVDKIRDKIGIEIHSIENNVQEIEEKIKAPSSAEGHEKERMRQLYYAMLNSKTDQLEGLKVIQGSPYFVRCDIKFKGAMQPRTFYFSKFGYQEENIFSWTVPAATMRFEDPGYFSYLSPKGLKIEAELLRKDQFMIVDGKILYLTTETLEEARQLVHQEHMPSRKSGFMLPEIVEQMEKAQDAVIRAYPTGSFLISGPAGSGKTTLALHRVAYLVQSPDTVKLFTEKPAIVFVQDTSSKNYFGSLLPQLGITNVKITTYYEWALELLGLEDYRLVFRYGKSESERDLIEYYKTHALNTFNSESTSKDHIKLLKLVYSDILPLKLYERFEEQIEDRMLDRFDLTLLLKHKVLSSGTLTKTKLTYGNRKIKGKYQRISVQEAVEYSLVIMDEVQNYLPEQINLIKSTISKNTQAMLYVGDLSQQTRLSTIRNWEQINEGFTSDRKAILDKVYRNTRQILEYINSLGYNSLIPNGIKNGTPVKEIGLETLDIATDHIKNIINNSGGKTLGILAKDAEYIDCLKYSLGNINNVFFMTINEAQGVEFDVVIFCGISKETYTVTSDQDYPEELIIEKNKVLKDLIYVALTRAISELIIIGETPLKEIVESL